MTVEDQLRQAVNAHTASVPEPPDRWDEIESRADGVRKSQRERHRAAAWTGLGLVAAAVVAFAFIVPAVNRDSHQRVSTKPPATTPVTTAAPITTTTSTPPVGTTVPPAATSTTTKSAGSPLAPYQALWPFHTLAEARTWEAGFQSGGHQPWHIDAGQTALSFTNGYLGYTEINKVVGQTVNRTGAHVSVGYKNPGGQMSTAAVIHLVRFGTDTNAPWEVVGTDDTPSFALTIPAYGATVTSPIKVGGTITGVDESIKVQVLQPSSPAPVGTSPGVSAGGTATPWHAAVSFRGATDPVLTVAASTGGHVQGVERFTVTGVTTSR